MHSAARQIGVVVAAAAVGLAPLAVTGAVASAAPRPAELRMATVKPTKDKVFGGWLAEPKTFTSVVATVEVPVITSCATSENSGLAPVVILVGPTFFAGAGAELSCEHGTEIYQVAVNFNGNEKKLITVAPRDELSVSVQLTKTSTDVTIVDTTSGKRISQKGPAGKVEGAEFGDDSLTLSSGPQLPLPHFSAHNLKNCKVNGKSLASSSPLVEEDLVKGSTILDEPTAITRAGTAFAMDFKATK